MPYVDTLTSESASPGAAPTKIPEDSPPAIGPDPKPLIIKTPKLPPKDSAPGIGPDPKPKIDPIVPGKKPGGGGGGGGGGSKPPAKGKPNTAERVTSDTKPKCKRGLLNLCVKLSGKNPIQNKLLMALTKMNGLKIEGK